MDLDQSLRDYWKWRLNNHYNDRYRDRQLTKMPEDLRTYQKVIEQTKPTVIIELGTYHGGSAMWLRDQMIAINGDPAWVVTVDLYDPNLDYFGVIPVVGDLRAEWTVEHVRAMADLHDDDRVMVIDDSQHDYETTSASLRLYSPFVTPGCYFVVEDGIVDEPELSVWPGVHGVQPAIVDFLATDAGKDFTREWKDEFILTMHQGGWLRRGEA